MERLVQLLQGSPLAVLTMFTISIVSGAMTIVLGWKQVYKDYLCKGVTIPVWLFLCILFVVSLVVIFKPALTDRPKELKTIDGVSFGVQRVLLDGKRFTNCTFDGSELLYTGEGGCELRNNIFRGIRITFDGPAGATVVTLTNMYRDPGFRPWIENTFSSIKEDRIKKATPPASGTGG